MTVAGEHLVEALVGVLVLYRVTHKSIWEYIIASVSRQNCKNCIYIFKIE